MSLRKTRRVAYLTGLLALALSSCSMLPSSGSESSAPASPAPSLSPPLSKPRSTASPLPSPSPTVSDPLTAPPRSSPVAKKMTTVNLYQIDSQCQKLVPTKAAVPAENPIEGAIDQLVAAQDSGDFSLAGYRIRLTNGVATVDLRTAPDSKRSIASLSFCEKMALLGGIQKTLTSNRSWGVRSVRFTEKGKEILI